MFSNFTTYLNSTKNFFLNYPCIKVILVLIIAYISFVVAKKYLLGFLNFLIKKSKNKWDDVFIQRKVFVKLAETVPAVIIYLFSSVVPKLQPILEKAALAYIVFIFIIVLSKFVLALEEIYNNFFEASKDKPIKGIVQTIVIVIYFVGAIVLIATLTGQSPAILFSGLGAMTAVLMLVFKDSILGLVAGLQVILTNSIKKGDWISMPNHNADGNVIEIALNSIKIKNWDNTVTIIPTHKLLNDSFTNWRGMQESGGRRISRNLYIDMKSVDFLTKNQIKKLKKIDLLTNYIEQKEKEIEQHNKNLKNNLELRANGRKLTNLGTFRAYLLNYLNNNPNIRNDMTVLVRQLAPSEKGIPIQIYAFTNTTDWVKYESIQSDIFDHLIAVLPDFDLKIFQNPTGDDFREIAKIAEK